MPEPTSREEHLQWAKDRALAYVDRGDLVNAWASFSSDMGKHEGTRDAPIGVVMVADVLPAIQRNDARRVRRAIEGFN